MAHGLGIGIAPIWQIRQLLDRGDVEIILEEFETPKRPIVAVSAPTKLPMAKTRLFTELLASRLKRERDL